MKVCTRLLMCPVCGGSLAEEGRTLKCSQAHSFDISREGYVNLLLTRGKRPKILGDTRDMLLARRGFLDRGHYAPLSETINRRVARCLGDVPGWSEEATPTCIVEVGCGEGYYVGRLKWHLDDRQGRSDICYFGMDISKEAARLAAKRYGGVRFIVADIKRRALFVDGSVRVVLNIFAPRNPVELARIVAPGEMLLVVIPNPDHLQNLRTALGLLGIEADKEQRVVEQFAGTFHTAGRQTVAYDMHLNGQDLFDLVRMTPNYWHASDETWDEAKAVESVHTRASFTMLEFRRNGSQSRRALGHSPSPIREV
jgi:23S rRNA (guanine745-N1)-methyltransferase